MQSPQQPWQITDDETEVPVRAATKHTPPEQEHTQSVSRRPAAIAGILLVTAIGVALMYDFQAPTGQVGETATVIRITNSGLEPLVVSAEAGDTLTWRNEQEIPHYLVSDTLCESADKENCMTTETMFQDEEVQYTIPAGTPPGAYTYFSPTDTNIIGTISVGGGANTGGATSSAPTTQQNSSTRSVVSSSASGISDPAVTTTTSASSSAAAATGTGAANSEPANPLLEAIQKQLELDRQSDPNAGPAPTGSQNTPSGTAVPGIPQNPYTANNTAGGPGPTPTPAGGTTQTPAMQSAQKPFKQPDTGTGTWLLALFGAASIWFVAKKVGKNQQVIRY